jgi:methylphosphotriester-DNA--protein-cysteine methyltransferase
MSLSLQTKHLQVNNQSAGDYLHQNAAQSERIANGHEYAGLASTAPYCQVTCDIASLQVVDYNMFARNPQSMLFVKAGVGRPCRRARIKLVKPLKFPKGLKSLDVRTVQC